jgi:hypothetical protein
MQYDYKGKSAICHVKTRFINKIWTRNKVGYFPSFTAGWIISDEGFFGDTKVVNFMKLRASYGTLGNDQIGNNGYVSQLNGEGTYVLITP